MGVATKVIEALQHPDEIAPLVKMWQESKRIQALDQGTPARAFCYDMLNKVSRSFAIVIQQLPASLRDPVCVFYLVLRALDTVEDDMAFPDARKLPLLDTFHEKIADPTFRLEGCGEKHCRKLLEEYPKVTEVFLALTPSSQAVIQDITRRMGAGMHEFIEKDVLTKDDYDLYCHYVAGLVGIGLCHLFAASGCEDASFAGKQMDTLANHMGLFLQKTNIIRDYLEDVEEVPAPRMFWPKQIWGQYAERLEDFALPENRSAAVKCLNEMVGNALSHLPHCLAYLEKLQDPEVFKFCAIPQVMAIGTLAQCYNNPRVFEGVVKMRRGQTAAVFDGLKGMPSVYQQFHAWGVILRRQVEAAEAAGDANARDTLAKVDALLASCRSGAQRLGVPLYTPASKVPMRTATVIVALGYLVYTLKSESIRATFGLSTSAGTQIVDQAQFILAVVLVAASVLMLMRT